MPAMNDTRPRNCYCGRYGVHDYGKGPHCQDAAPAPIAQPPHQQHADAFEDAHMTAAGAIMGARMAGRDIPPWSADMNEAFRAAVAEAFDAGAQAERKATR